MTCIMEIPYSTQLPLLIKVMIISSATLDSIVTEVSYHFHNFITL